MIVFCNCALSLHSAIAAIHCLGYRRAGGLKPGKTTASQGGGFAAGKAADKAETAAGAGLDTVALWKWPQEQEARETVERESGHNREETDETWPRKLFAVDVTERTYREQSTP
jgi:hypothetical protein